MFILNMVQAVEFGIYIIIPGDRDSRLENKADGYAVLNSSLEVLATSQPTVSQKPRTWGGWIKKQKMTASGMQHYHLHRRIREKIHRYNSEDGGFQSCRRSFVWRRSLHCGCSRVSMP